MTTERLSQEMDSNARRSAEIEALIEDELQKSHRETRALSSSNTEKIIMSSVKTAVSEVLSTQLGPAMIMAELPTEAIETILVNPAVMAVRQKLGVMEEYSPKNALMDVEEDLLLQTFLRLLRREKRNRRTLIEFVH